jgi:general secretion pathway protein I
MRAPEFRGPPGRQRGFTLLEVLLAFVIFALTFATVLEIVAASTRSTVRAGAYSEAALLAQSLAEQLGTEMAIEPGSYSGETEDGIAWVIEISDFEGLGDDTRTPELAGEIGTRLFWVDMTLSWGTEPRTGAATFTTLRSTVDSDP